MKQKQAIEICKNINSDSISDDDKFEAIDVVLDSRSNSMLLPKPIWVKTFKWYRAYCDEAEVRTIEPEQLSLKPIREERQSVVLKCRFCKSVIDKTTKYCGNCGQKIDWN